MKFSFEHSGKKYQGQTDETHSIGITLDFDGPQPNHFGTEQARREVLKLGEFVGDTSQGGSCNVDWLHLIPHCNGTHTETISHIVNDDIWVGHTAQEGLYLALLVSVKPVLQRQLPASQQEESYRPPLSPEDWVITAAMLKAAIGGFPQFQQRKPEALLVRTLPNSPDKKSRAYAQGNRHRFLLWRPCSNLRQPGSNICWSIFLLSIECMMTDY